MYTYTIMSTLLFISFFSSYPFCVSNLRGVFWASLSEPHTYAVNIIILSVYFPAERQGK